MAVTNTGIVLRTITGVNESDLFLDSEATSVTTNTGIVERSIVGVHDANFVHPIGDEEIINGGFDVDSDWNLQPSATIQDGKLVVNSITSGNIAQQVGVIPISKPIRVKFDLVLNSGGFRVLAGSGGTATNITASGSYTLYETSGTGGVLTLQSRFGSFNGSVDNISIKEVLVNRESTTTNTGIVERAITGSNESELWLETESTSVVNNTGIVERPITGVNTSDALFPDNTESTVVNISDTIIPLLTALEARATTFENREGTQNILINLEKC